MRTTDNLLSNVYFSCFELNFLERHHDVIKQKITMNSEKLCSVPTLCDPVDCSPPGSSCPWDSPGKNSGVGCHFLLQGIFPAHD